jgi:hypothetical protein
LWWTTNTTTTTKGETWTKEDVEMEKVAVLVGNVRVTQAVTLVAVTLAAQLLRLLLW